MTETESEWRACLEEVLASSSEPEAQRFAAACCRRAWHFMDDPRHRSVVEVAELLADGRATAAKFERTMAPVVALWADLPPRGPEGNVPYQRWQPWQHLTGATRHLGSRGAAPWAALFAARAVACRSGEEYGSEGWIVAWLEEVAAQRELVATVQRHSEPLAAPAGDEVA
jgi:hypothetical protein